MISNKKNKQIEIYDVSGQLLRSFGQNFHGFEDEIEEKPHGVAVNSKGKGIEDRLDLRPSWSEII